MLKLTIKSKDILRGAMSLSVSVSGRCESQYYHFFFLSRAQIICRGSLFSSNPLYNEQNI